MNGPESYQFCNEDGTAWYDCGEFDLASDGAPRPPANPKSGSKRASENDDKGNGKNDGKGNGKAP